MSSQSRNKKTSTSKQKKANGGSSKKTASKKSAAPPPSAPLFGARVKNDLIGIVIAVVAVVLLVILLLPSSAVGAQFISQALHLIFGQGAFLLPFLLLGWSATFFVRQRLTNSPLRLAIGLGVIYLALISIFAAMTPQATSDPLRIFDPVLLIHQGGYLGGAVAFALLSLIGQVPTMIILVGLILIGFVLIGLSITGLMDWIICSLKGRGKSKDEIPLPGALQQNLGGTAAGAARGGSAYQMGPNDPASTGAKGRNAKNGRHSAGREALLQPTGVMGAAQLEDTLCRPSGGFANEEVTFAGLGSTRRRLARDAGGGVVGASDSQGRTVLLSDDSGEGAQSSALSPEGSSGAQGETTLLAHAEKTGSGKGKKKKTSGSVGASGNAVRETHYVLPNRQLLRISREKANTKAGAQELRATANRLQETMEEFRVDGEVVGWIAGPTVTLYKISLGEGVRLNRVTALQSDIQLALAAQAIRIVAPIPGTSLVGIEIPNAARNEVLLGDVLASARDSVLALAIGKDVEGESIVADLASMPHLLIGGTTGSGKSVAVNSIIMSILMRATPEEVRLIMIDPKRVELTLYNGIPHLYVPVVTDSGQAASALAWCVAEMDRRLKMFEKHTVKNIRQFNTRVADNLEKIAAADLAAAASAAASGDDFEGDSQGDSFDNNPGASAGSAKSASSASQSAFSVKDRASGEIDITVEQENLRATLPYLVIVIDELADLMMMNGKEVEGAISRLAQLARAAGLHLVVATQRPSTNVITGLIKANIVNRIAFTVASGIDSRVILDTPGAEDLIGLGDMLFSRPEYSKPVRIQGCLVSEPEIETVVEYWRSQGETDYHEEILHTSSGSSIGGGFSGDDSLEDDPLLWDAAEIIVSAQLGSTSTLQRRLKVGYARAGRIMDMLEMKGVVGPPNGSKPREVLVDDVLDLETLRAYG